MRYGWLVCHTCLIIFLFLPHIVLFLLFSDWCRSKFQQFWLLPKWVLEFWRVECQIHISRITRLWIEKKKCVLLASVLLMCLFSVVFFIFFFFFFIYTVSTLILLPISFLLLAYNENGTLCFRMSKQTY